MTPTRSNLNKQTCTPVSSNCIIWEGENIECIDLCRGDSISDVTYKLALELCSIKNTLNLSDLDLSCIVSACEECPDPSKDLENVLQLIIIKICLLEGLIPDPTPTPDELIVNIAPCFQYINDDSDLVTQLPLSEYVKKIGIMVCNYKAITDGHTTTLSDHEDRIEALENAAPPSVNIPKVIPTCTFNDNVARNVDVVVTALEHQFCDYKGVLGSAVNLSQSVSKQCQGLKDVPALAGTGNMSGMSGWVNSPTTVADTLNNMWLTICDIRAALQNISDCCSPVCNDVIIDFNLAANEDRSVITLFFNGITSIPTGWAECNQAGSALTVTDSAGHVFHTNVGVVANKSVVDGVDIDLSGSTINTNLTYTVVLDACVIKDGVTCNKTVTKTDTPPCGVPTAITATLI